MEEKSTKSIIVLLSGNGSTFQAIYDNCKDYDINRVYSNNLEAYGLVRATQLGIQFTAIRSHSRLEEIILDDLDNILSHVKLIVLAGYMKILSPMFIQQCKSMNVDIINIHPSLLPKYKGLHTHKRVLEEKEDCHGMTIHYVNEELDGGPIIFQQSFDIRPDDTEQTLIEKVKQLEQKYYPMVINLVLRSSHTLNGNWYL